MKRVLDPVERSSEIIFGLIMALSFTGILSVASAGRQSVRDMLVAAVGCSAAWGLVDGVMYVITNMLLRTRELSELRAVRAASDPTAAARLIEAALPEGVAGAFSPAEIARVHARLQSLPEPPRVSGVTKADVLGALACFLLVMVATLPVAAPFAFVDDARRALRISNAIAIVLLFASGVSLGAWSGYRPVRAGLVVVFVGVVLTALTIALGG